MTRGTFAASWMSILFFGLCLLSNHAYSDSGWISCHGQCFFDGTAKPLHFRVDVEQASQCNEDLLKTVCLASCNRSVSGVTGLHTVPSQSCAVADEGCP